MKALKKGVTVIVSIVLWGVILLAALFAFTTLATRDNANVSSLAGYTPMVVKTESMAPTFYSGDLIFIKKCDTSKLTEGDIICFHTIINNEYALNTHRIEKSMKTKICAVIPPRVIITRFPIHTSFLTEISWVNMWAN